MTKKERLSAIIKLIEEKEICTQEELTEGLLSLGFNVSQSTVSRDINELNLIKVEGVNKKIKYAKAGTSANTISPQVINLFKHITISITIANNLLVLKTLSGNASSAATAIDQMGMPQILGTIAGDDTVLVVAKTNSDAEFILKSLRSI